MTKTDLTLREAAERLGCSDETVRRMLRDGRFPNAWQMNPGAATSPFFIPLRDVIAFEKERRRPFSVKSISSRGAR